MTALYTVLISIQSFFNTHPVLTHIAAVTCGIAALYISYILLIALFLFTP